MDTEAIIKPLVLKDLRVQCRQRGLTPAGSRDDLAQRLKEHMLTTQDFHLRGEDGCILAPTAGQLYGQGSAETGNNYARPSGQNVGNFLGSRPSSRVLAAPGGNSNVNLGDMPAHQISATNAGTNVSFAPKPLPPVSTPPPQGKPNSFLDSMTAKIASRAGVTPTSSVQMQQSMQDAPEYDIPPFDVPEQTQEMSQVGNKRGIVHGQSNNNYHRPGGQNVGNYLTDRNSSRVLAPPGGASSVTLG